ncbi:hypothetical protein [Cedecea lapagei]|uniref:hypothetical protein n=1 Tax=Cedecea lapagei TaxID=158823 RepID=UPI001BCC53A7|nr:hypothetical protein [Cedecea lapagei]
MNKLNDLIDSKPAHYEAARTKWQSMHNRVAKDPNYSHITICDEWYTLSNFYNWFITQPNNHWQLDKDIKGGNEYSPEYCIFVPSEVNMLFRNVKTSLMKGVVRNCDGYQAQGNFGAGIKKFGTYSTVEEAHGVYIEKRKDYLYELSVKYTNSGELSAILLNLSK